MTSKINKAPSMRKKEKKNRIPKRLRWCRYRKNFCRQFWIGTISSFGLSQICLKCTFLRDNLSANNYTAYDCTFMGNFIARNMLIVILVLRSAVRSEIRFKIWKKEAGDRDGLSCQRVKKNSSTCLKISCGISREIWEQKYKRWIYVSIGLLHLSTFNNVLV